MIEELFGAVEQYIEERFATEDEILQDVRRRSTEKGLPEIQITPVQGKQLQLLARAANAERVLELGTLGGYSAIWLARALPSTGKLITFELSVDHAEVARENISNAALETVVEVRNSSAMEGLRALIDTDTKPFDLIFMDCDKALYLQYFQYALRLSRPGTLIIADNVVREGKILEPDHPELEVEGVQRLMEYLSTSREVDATVLQQVGRKGHDGMLLALVN